MRHWHLGFGGKSWRRVSHRKTRKANGKCENVFHAAPPKKLFLDKNQPQSEKASGIDFVILDARVACGWLSGCTRT
jgi:hypothetical protein